MTKGPTSRPPLSHPFFSFLLHPSPSLSPACPSPSPLPHYPRAFSLSAEREGRATLLCAARAVGAAAAKRPSD